MERINEAVPGCDYESIQHFISHSPWDHRAVFNQVASDANTIFAECDKVALLIDESAHIKKGDKSVGVSRQYCGQTGKVDNCQVAVYGALSYQPFYALVDAELYLPQSWTGDAKRCDKAGVPKERQQHKTKGELALAIIRRQIDLGTRFDWIGADGFYGNDYQLCKAIDELGRTFVFEVHSNQRVYLQSPVIEAACKVQAGTGSRPASAKPKTESKSVEVRQWASEQLPAAWKPVIVRCGTKGPIRAEIIVRKVYVWDRKEEQARQRLLIVRRTRGPKGSEEIKYALTNAEEGQYSDEELARMLSERYFVERSFQDAKQEIGMSQYQVRGWKAWHHHIAMVMMSLMFILREKVIFNEQKPLLSANDVRYYIINTYARKASTPEQVNKIIEIRHDLRRKSMPRDG